MRARARAILAVISGSMPNRFERSLIPLMISERKTL